MAIERQTIIVADHAQQRLSTPWAIDLDESVSVDLTQPIRPIPNSSANYVLGVAHQFATVKRGLPLPNLDLAITSTVPIGAGLSSSAAVEVAFATLLEELLNLRLTPVQKALLCQTAEHEFTGTPCGLMDMYISCAAKPGHALLIDCRSNQVQPVALPPASEATVLIVNSGVKHTLAGGEYARRRATCEAAANKLGIAALRDADVGMLDRRSLTLDEKKKALHVIAENARTVLAAESLAAGSLDSFGDLMFASHDSLRDLFEVSCDELNVLVESVRNMKGREVFGARMTGGGFGGCAVVLCRSDAVEEVKRRMNDAFRAAFERDCEMFTTGAAGAARMLQIGATRQGESWAT